jgi:hypothetical protein
MIQNKLILISFLLLFLFGCRKNIENQIGIKGRDCPTNSNCVITISQLTDFSWDKMYVFEPTESFQTINKIIDIDYSKFYKDFTRPIIFTKGKKIVHYENNRSDPEDVIDGQVIFDYPDSLKYMVYTPSNARFNLKAKSSGDKIYYILTLISN